MNWFGTYISSRNNFLRTVSAISLSFVSVQSIAYSEEDSKYISFCLSEDSQTKLKEYLNKYKSNSIHGRLVIIKKLTNDEASQYTYEPIFGEKAAFRLKGIATSSSGLTTVSHNTYKTVVK